MSDADLADWLAARLSAGAATIIVRIAQARGSAGTGMTTYELMALLRGETE